MRPLVSVITTLYNCEQYIEKSLASICEQQDFKDFEWLIYSDGPTDRTWDLVEGCLFKAPAGPHIITCADSKNIKIPWRRNQAIAAAKGKYIAIHDGDDISMPDRLKTQVEFLESNADIFCVGSHAFKIDVQGQRIGIMDYPSRDHASLVMKMVQKQNPMIDPSTMFRREDFMNLGGYPLEKRIYTVPDMDVWCRAILAGLKLANIQKPLIEYRTNPEGMTGRHKPEMIKAHMTVWRRFMDAYQKRSMQVFAQERNHERPQS